ncbi:MAG: hypothetical protein ABIT05_00530 [Chitinophagaceae bacterium]
MTRYFILSFFFLATASLGSFASHATTDKAINASTQESFEIGTAAQSTPLPPVKNMPALPAAEPFQPVQKAHGQVPSFDELAHVHRFHKGRVKKIKKHHKKYWAFSKLILVLCHIAILVIAYMHVTH